MELEMQSPGFIERLGRFFLFRAVVYLLPVLYVVRLVLMILTPESYHMPGWREVLWQGARDASVVLNLFYWQGYFANYTARRASLRTRRRDTLAMALLAFLYFNVEMPALLGLPWLRVSVVSAVLCLAVYVSEMRIIRRLEAATQQRLT